MHHTIITFDLATFHKLNVAGALVALLNDTIDNSDTVIDGIELDEWMTTVIQVAPDGTRTPVEGYRTP